MISDEIPYLSAAKSKIVNSDCAPTRLTSNHVDQIHITEQAAIDPLIVSLRVSNLCHTKFRVNFKTSLVCFSITMMLFLSSCRRTAFNTFLIISNSLAQIRISIIHHRGHSVILNVTVKNTCKIFLNS